MPASSMRSRARLKLSCHLSGADSTDGQTTLLIPPCMIAAAQFTHGWKVAYRVDPSVLAPFFAALSSAFTSAWTV